MAARASNKHKKGDISGSKYDSGLSVVFKLDALLNRHRTCIESELRGLLAHDCFI